MFFFLRSINSKLYISDVFMCTCLFLATFESCSRFPDYILPVQLKKYHFHLNYISNPLWANYINFYKVLIYNKRDRSSFEKGKKYSKKETAKQKKGCVTATSLISYIFLTLFDNLSKRDSKNLGLGYRTKTKARRCLDVFFMF